MGKHKNYEATRQIERESAEENDLHFANQPNTLMDGGAHIKQVGVSLDDIQKLSGLLGRWGMTIVGAIITASVSGALYLNNMTNKINNIDTKVSEIKAEQEKTASKLDGLTQEFRLMQGKLGITPTPIIEKKSDNSTPANIVYVTTTPKKDSLNKLILNNNKQR